MSKGFAISLCLISIGCAMTPETQVGERQGAAQTRRVPNLDRTYDWGAKPPGAINPPHIQD